jgi:hypothetical protein
MSRLLLGVLIVAMTAGLATRPAGRMRATGSALADASGAQNWLGATLFWLAWAYKHDRARLERNLQWLADHDFDYVRALGVVGGNEFWAARPSDPAWPDYAEVIAGATDLAYDTYGLRVQWTIFGGTELAPTPARRQQIVDLFAAMTRRREHKLFLFEIANEAWHVGFSASDPTELRRLGARLNGKTEVPVALTAPLTGQECAVYAGSGADVATLHYSRSDDGAGWGSVARPWGWPREYEAGCRGRLPPVVVNNEPIGIDSSVNEEGDPRRLALAYATTFLAGNAAYVFHTGAGIRGGSFDGDDRKANLWEQDRADEAAGALARLRRSLPPGLAQWTRHDASARGAPFTDGASRVEDGTVFRLYAARRRGRFVAVVLDQKRALALTAAFAMRVQVIDAVTGDVYRQEQLGIGDKLSIAQTGGWLLLGEDK